MHRGGPRAVSVSYPIRKLEQLPNEQLFIQNLSIHYGKRCLGIHWRVDGLPPLAMDSAAFTQPEFLAHSSGQHTLHVDQRRAVGIISRLQIAYRGNRPVRWAQLTGRNGGNHAGGGALFVSLCP